MQCELKDNGKNTGNDEVDEKINQDFGQETPKHDETSFNEDERNQFQAPPSNTIVVLDFYFPFFSPIAYPFIVKGV